MAYYGGKSSSDAKRLAAMPSKAREEAIAKLERERMKINAEIEGILRAYSKESGNRALKRRRHKIGFSPNDYGFVGKADKEDL